MASIEAEWSWMVDDGDYDGAAALLHENVSSAKGDGTAPNVVFADGYGDAPLPSGQINDGYGNNLTPAEQVARSTDIEVQA